MMLNIFKSWVGIFKIIGDKLKKKPLVSAPHEKIEPILTENSVPHETEARGIEDPEETKEDASFEDVTPLESIAQFQNLQDGEADAIRLAHELIERSEIKTQATPIINLSSIVEENIDPTTKASQGGLASFGQILWPYKKIMAGVVVFILLLGGGGYAFFSIYHPPPDALQTKGAESIVSVHPSSPSAEKGAGTQLAQIAKERPRWQNLDYIAPIYLEKNRKDEPLLSIILYDVGLNEDVDHKVLSELPEVVSLAYSCYADDLDAKIKRAADMGFVTLMTIPLEDNNGKSYDLGKYTLLTGGDVEKNIAKMKVILEKTSRYDMVFLQGGNIFLSSHADLEPIIAFLRKYKKFVVTPPDCFMSKLSIFCEKSRVNFAPTTTFVPYHQVDQLMKILDDAAENAQNLGRVILAVPAMNFTVSCIKEWINNCDESTLFLVSISEMYAQSE